MSAAVAEKLKSFSPAAKKYRPKDSHLFAEKHSGAARQVVTEHGVEIANDGDYIVQVGELVRSQTIAPSVSKDGSTRIPGEIRDVKEPKFEVMRAEDFDSLYELA